MDLLLIKDYIGSYSPMILFVVSFFLLIGYNVYFDFFLIGFVLNNILNILLKIIIQQPRPSKDNKKLEIYTKNGERIWFDEFGMPSGHGQNCGFFISYIYLILKNPWIISFYLIVSFISLNQRVIYQNHTILQVIVGFLLGLAIGIMVYKIANKFIQGPINSKPDDNAPV